MVFNRRDDRGYKNTIADVLTGFPTEMGRSHGLDLIFPLSLPSLVCCAAAVQAATWTQGFGEVKKLNFAEGTVSAPIASALVSSPT